jgi:hypothetical protein
MRHSPFRFLALSLALVAAGCARTAPVDANDSSIVQQPGVVISADFVATTGDAYTILGRPFMRGDALHVTVQYGGGCARHEFSLVASQGFMESHPVQSAIAILHRGHGDACKALLQRELIFDLTALKNEWRRAYQANTGTIILRLRGYSEGINYTF